jgi:hypothetical protein
MFLLPTLIFFVGYQVYPIIRVIWISFTNYEFLSNEPAQYVGFANYIEAINDPLMWASLWRAALFTIMFLPGTIILPLLLAVLIDRVSQPRLATVYRVILLIPAVIARSSSCCGKWMYNYRSGRLTTSSSRRSASSPSTTCRSGSAAPHPPAIAIMEVCGARLPHHLLPRRPAAIPGPAGGRRIDGATNGRSWRHPAALPARS